MSFFQKVKLWLGMGGVKVTLEAPAQVSKDAGTLDVKVNFTSKSDLQMEKLELKLIEEWSTGIGAKRETKELVLGSLTRNLSRAIKAGETQSDAFTLNFSYGKSKNESMAEKGGVIGGLGKLASFASQEKSVFYVKADVEVKSVMIGPSARADIKLV